MKSKFKVGDKVVAKPYRSKGARVFYECKTVSYVRDDGWVNIDGIVDDFPYYSPDILELEEVYNSPLYKALME